jgi:hypothetical protein
MLREQEKHGTWHTHAPASLAGDYGKTQGGHGLSDGAAALDVRGADLPLTACFGVETASYQSKVLSQFATNRGHCQ